MSLSRSMGLVLSHRPPTGPAAMRPLTPHLRLERLEDRSVPANFTAATVAELIGAMDAANLTPEADQITLEAGTTYTLTAHNNNEWYGAMGLPKIAEGGDLTIVGDGAVIERSAAAGTPKFRLLAVEAGASLRLQHLILQGGFAMGSLSGDAAGAAIRSEGNLTLDHVNARNNVAQGGEGDAVWGVPSPGGHAFGGAVYSTGSLVMTECIITGNAAIGGRGSDGVNSPNPNYKNGTRGGSASGGGVYAANFISISSSTITDNIAQGGAGGDRFGNGSATGGAGGAGVGGGLSISATSAILSGVTVTANFALGGAGGSKAVGGDSFGGGLCLGGESITIDNSIIRENTAQGGAGTGGDGGVGFGGGLYLSASSVTLQQVAVEGNRALGGSGKKAGKGIGGGIYIAAESTVWIDEFTVSHTLGNSSSNHNNIAGSYILV